MITLTGDTADWVSAIGQVVGAVGTFVAVVVALGLGLRESRSARAEREDRDAGQARLVVSEVRQERRQWWVRTTNHSGSPVFDVRVIRVDHDGRVLTAVDAPAAPAVIDVLTAGQSLDRALDGDGSTAAVPVIRFLDARGLLWERAGISQPVRVQVSGP